MFRRQRLYTTLLLAVSLCAIVIIATFATVSHFSLSAQLHQDIQKTAKTALRRALTVLPAALWEYNETYVRDYLASNFMADDVAYVRIVSEGEVYEQTADRYRALLHDDFQDQERFYHSAAVIRYQDRPIGTFELALSYDRMNQVLTDNLWRSILLMALLIVSMSGAVLFLVRVRIIRPIKTLERVTAKVAGGDLTASTGMTRKDEIGLLGKSLDHMITSLKQITASRDELDAEIKLRTEAETQLANQRDTIQLYLDIADVALLALDRAGTIAMLNRRGRELLGCMDEKVVGLNWFDNFLPREVHDKVHEHFAKVLAGEPNADGYYESLALTRSGETRLFVWHNAPIMDEAGNVIGTMSSGQDITDTRAAELALQKSEERYRQLVESMNEGVITIDADGVVSYANQRFCSMLDCGCTEVIGQRLESYFSDLELRKYQDMITVLSEHDASSMELALHQPNNQTLYTFFSPAPHFNEEGEYLGATIAVADITHLKNLEGQLIQAQMLESIGSLAAGIAHEINTPCQYVSNNVQFITEAYASCTSILDEYDSFRETAMAGGDVALAADALDRLRENLDIEMIKEELPQALEETKEGLDRITTIVQSVKQFAHPGKDEIIPADINEAVRNSVTVSTNEWKVYANVTMFLDEDLPKVPCVISQINQVLLNLIVNASHAISQQVDAGDYAMGSITVRTGVEDDMAVITVEDNGSGIPEDARAHVFKPFFTTKAPGKGTGQGLSISHTTIVEKHKGSLTFTTEEGVGTTFRIALPLEKG